MQQIVGSDCQPDQRLQRAARAVFTGETFTGSTRKRSSRQSTWRPGA